MRVRRGGPWLSIPLTITLAIAAGCGSEAEPKHNAGSIHDAAGKLGPKATELKQLQGVPMKELPEGLKPLDGDDGKTEPEPTVAGLKPLSKKAAPAAGLPSGLKAFPAEPTEAPKAEPAAEAEPVAEAEVSQADDAQAEEPGEAPPEPTAQ